MKKFDIEKESLEFKNLLSGPAPVGRILNYVYEAGTNGLFHKNGYRSLEFKDRIGSAWTTEFMIGLGIFELGEEVGNKTQLILSLKGKTLFDIMFNGNYNAFDEGVTDESIELVKKQIAVCSPKLYGEYRKLFISSIPFKILKEFLAENGYYYQDRNIFMDDLFEQIKIMYDVETSAPYNRDARTPTSRNRVPSLLQLCKLFNMLDDSDNKLNFMKKAILSINVDEEDFSAENMKKEAKKLEKMLLETEGLAEKYGVEGTVLSESIVRNSNLQRIFKYNLLVSQGCKCAVCEISNEEVLNGSHIKPAAKCNADEKADFNNGLLLCCNHDRLFDRYLITFNFMDGQIETSKVLSDEDIKHLNLDKNFKLNNELLTIERRKYLTEHNIEFRKKEEDR